MNYSGLVRHLFNYVKTGFLEEMTPNMAPAGHDWSQLPGSDKVIMLTDDSIGNFISSQDSAMIMFYAQWCGHCKSAKPGYAKAAQRLSEEDPTAGLAAVDCQIYHNIGQKYKIAGYPTFHYYRNGKLIGEYYRGREASDFLEFMLRKPSSRIEM